MSYQILVGANITDQHMYEEYRRQMFPLLSKSKGEFLYDFNATPLEMGKLGQNYNRVFVISFPDENTKTGFFADPDYLKIRQTLLLGAVSEIEQISHWSSN